MTAVCEEPLSARRQRLKADTSDIRASDGASVHRRYKGTTVPIPRVDVAGFQWPLLTPVQQAPNNNNRGMVEVELDAAQQHHHHLQHYSTSEAILIYNQQLHADQSANAIAGETSSSADGALTGSDGRCGPHSVELSTSASQPCAEACVLVCAAGCARYARSRKLCSCMQQTYIRPTPRTRPASQRTGSRNFQRHVTF
jgi:hypothetical protein